MKYSTRSYACDHQPGQPVDQSNSVIEVESAPLFIREKRDSKRLSNLAVVSEETKVGFRARAFRVPV